ncbi:MAG: GAF domain-containing sensor histidine kinase [Chitinophagaceae bacterium]|nr:MAG: GAF domain-containing sensor histidine kinase [Chitinophagaceae bacterium]
MTHSNLPAFLRKEIDAVSKIPVIDTILEVVCRTTGMGFAAVARVTDTKWVACVVKDDISFGLQPGGELALQTTICNEIRQHRQMVVIDHVEEDEQFRNHHTPSQYGFQSYISVPIILKSGQFFGTLCAIDPNPARLKDPQIMDMFSLFADLISFHLHTLGELELSREDLREQRRIEELREQFVAILGHDLRNPLGSIMVAAELLSSSDLAEDNLEIVKRIKRSSHRMSDLITNILDFASGRMGAGIVLNRANVGIDQLNLSINQITEELQALWPGRMIEIATTLSQEVNMDAGRFAQLFSNLLANALMHGDPNSPVFVNAISTDKVFKLTVSNAGPAIPIKTQQKLFQPFYRGEDKPDKNGLGLGLYIASEIAVAHGGGLSMESTEASTSFTFLLPAPVPAR